EHGGDVYAGDGIFMDFSVNINPLGMPTSVKQAIIDHVPEYARYPDPSCRALRSAIAAHHGLEASMVICGNGASELIFALCACFKPQTVLVPAPTFSEYERAATLFGSEVREHPLVESDSFALMESILEDITAQTQLLFLCNPNNPTGQLADPALLCNVAEVCRKNQTLLLLDECFMDFTRGKSMLPHLEKYPNMLILRAFTKTYAMAGLRLGVLYGADERLLSNIAAHMPTWSVSSVAQAAGIAALQEKDWIEETQCIVENERVFMAEALCSLGLTVYPSDANFLLFKSKRPLAAPLRAHGVLTRSCENFSGLDERYIRIGLKNHNANLALLRTMSEVLNG
ncbi:MAG: threonine-phosphate decarboxylase CobD, partial [Oscillospiraceae bacterium]